MRGWRAASVRVLRVWDCVTDCETRTTLTYWLAWLVNVPSMVTKVFAARSSWYWGSVERKGERTGPPPHVLPPHSTHAQSHSPLVLREVLSNSQTPFCTIPPPPTGSENIKKKHKMQRKFWHWYRKKKVHPVQYRYCIDLTVWKIDRWMVIWRSKSISIKSHKIGGYPATAIDKLICYWRVFRDLTSTWSTTLCLIVWLFVCFKMDLSVQGSGMWGGSECSRNWKLEIEWSSESGVRWKVVESGSPHHTVKSAASSAVMRAAFTKRSSSLKLSEAEGGKHC